MSIYKCGVHCVAPASGEGLTVTKTAVDMISSGEDIIHVTDTSSLRTITISSADIAIPAKIIIIKDESAGAGVNNIIINTEGTEKVDTSSIQLINVSGGTVVLYSDGFNLFVMGKYK